MGVYIDSIMEISPEIVEKALAAYGELKREVTEQIKSLAKHPQIVPITAGAAISAILLWRMTTSDNKSVESSKSQKSRPSNPRRQPSSRCCSRRTIHRGMRSMRNGRVTQKSSAESKECQLFKATTKHRRPYPLRVHIRDGKPYVIRLV